MAKRKSKVEHLGKAREIKDLTQQMRKDNQLFLSSDPITGEKHLFKGWSIWRRMTELQKHQVWDKVNIK